MMYRKFNDGTIEVICGSMFAGKSSELIRRLEIMSFSPHKIVAFKPAIDNRYDMTAIASHNGSKFEAHAVTTVEDVIKVMNKNPDAKIVAFDEIQFLPIEIVQYISALADNGKRVICAGLNTDFRGEPFPVMKEIMARAEFHTNLQAVCVICGAPGTRNQRIVNDEPAKFTDPIVMVGAEESYQSRCRHCHQVPGKPNKYKK